MNSPTFTWVIWVPTRIAGGQDEVNWTVWAVEIEAEAVAFIVTTRVGLTGPSAAYVSSYLKAEDHLPPSVSLDLVAKVASRIEEMRRRRLPWRGPRRTAKSGTTQ